MLPIANNITIGLGESKVDWKTNNSQRAYFATVDKRAIITIFIGRYYFSFTLYVPTGKTYENGELFNLDKQAKPRKLRK